MFIEILKEHKQSSRHSWIRRQYQIPISIKKKCGMEPAKQAEKLSSFENDVKYIAKAIKSQLTIRAYGNVKLILEIYYFILLFIFS